jgi:hypothetical protein
MGEYAAINMILPAIPTNIIKHAECSSLKKFSSRHCNYRGGEWNQNEVPHGPPYNQNQMEMGALGAVGMGGVLGYALGGMSGGPGGFWPHRHGPGGFGPGPGRGHHHHGPRSPLDVCWSCLSL